ncbi:hypothetical protein Goshw_002547, partial [Gossypium schwendimanii]|nr:hypothetical protein [Gossypium schwendimanii]
MDEGKSKRIISRFRKEFPVSEDYQRTQIRAKFYNGILHLVMPKQIIPTISAPAGGGGDENNDVAKSLSIRSTTEGESGLLVGSLETTSV